MKESLATGLTTTHRVTIDLGRTIGFFGEEGRVYATPELVRDIENTCRDLLLEHLDAGEDSVGMRVEVDHLAPTPLGMWVEVSADLVELDGRRATFTISARDPVEAVAQGRHVRYIVDAQKTVARLQKKIQLGNNRG
jgi:fluoroacetyl-CoA thioesterase